MLVRSVIDHKFGDDADAAGMRGADEMAEIGQRAVVGMYVAIGADVVTVIEPRRRDRTATAISTLTPRSAM